MSDKRSEAAWAAFWKAGGTGPESGCLPKALSEIDLAQRRIWQDAARPLRRGARVLDLATGDGAVLDKILRFRSDLKLLGIDSSSTLPAGRKGVTLRAGVRMEQLPFADDSFDLVTSQFGIEYGDIPPMGREVARVLRKDGSFHFLAHYSGGPIVAHNQKRRGSLVWAAVESGLLGKARAFVNARQIADLPTPPSFREAPAAARRMFPGQSAGEEFATAILQTLELGRRAPARESLEILQILEAKALNEIVRIEVLGNAARDAEQIETLREELRGAGLAPAEPTLVHDAGRGAFAWHLSGTR